jgi:hypothetical protein
MIEGLLGVSRDFRISTVIMDEDYAAISEFEHVPNLFVEAGRHLVLRFRNPTLLNTCSRFLVAVPPLMEKQPGFSATWEVVQKLLVQVGSRLVLLSTLPTVKTMEQKGWLITGDPNTTTINVRNWHDLPGVLKGSFKEGDLPVLIQARTGRLAWQPIQARLSSLLDKILEHKPLLMIYPPEMKWETEHRAVSPAGDFQAVFPPESVFLKMREPDIRSAITTLINTVFTGSTPLRDRLIEDSFFQQREAALWLSPESLLLHTHKAFPPAPMALLATSAGGFQGMGNGEKVKSLVLLLGTPEESAEEHLRRLARIASLFHEKGILEGIIRAERYEDVLSHDGECV